MSRIFKINFILAVLVYQAWGTHALQEDALSFHEVVKKAYTDSQVNQSKNGFISSSLETKIGSLALNFEEMRRERCIDLSQCHIVCAMLGCLLQSGCKELVELYYYIVDSYQKQPNFLQSVTGYDWDRSGQRQANTFERQVYDTGNQIRGFTYDLIHKRNLGDQRVVPWVHDEDGWHMHGIWSDMLLNQYSSSRESDQVKKSGVFWAFMLYQPLWEYFQPMVPEFMWPFVPLDSRRGNATYKKQNEPMMRMVNAPDNARDKVWQAAWLCDSGNDEAFYCRLYNFNYSCNEMVDRNYCPGWGGYVAKLDTDIKQAMAEELERHKTKAATELRDEMQVLERLGTKKAERIQKGIGAMKTRIEELKDIVSTSYDPSYQLRPLEIDRLRCEIRIKKAECERLTYLSHHSLAVDGNNPDVTRLLIDTWKTSSPFEWEQIGGEVRGMLLSYPTPTRDAFKQRIAENRELGHREEEHVLGKIKDLEHRTAAVKNALATWGPVGQLIAETQENAKNHLKQAKEQLEEIEAKCKNHKPQDVPETMFQELLQKELEATKLSFLSTLNIQPFHVEGNANGQHALSIVNGIIRTAHQTTPDCTGLVAGSLDFISSLLSNTSRPITSEQVRHIEQYIANIPRISTWFDRVLKLAELTMLEFVKLREGERPSVLKNFDKVADLLGSLQNERKLIEVNEFIQYFNSKIENLNNPVVVQEVDDEIDRRMKLLQPTE